MYRFISMKRIFVNIIAAVKCLLLVLFDRSEEKIGKILKNKKSKLTTAESCTGGLLSSFLTDVSGSSEYIKANFVTYANEAKETYLSVSPDILNEYGAVSPQTARAMIEGLLEHTDADYAAATTGIAGPTGGSKDKPVGLVYIGTGNREKIVVKQYNVHPLTNRRLIKILFAKEALKMLKEFLEENEKCTD